jgi:hypothetical protein
MLPLRHVDPVQVFRLHGDLTMTTSALRSMHTVDAHEDPHASNVVPFGTTRAVLPLDALRRLLDVSTRLLDDERAWLLGDDRSTVLAARADLAMLVRIMESGLRMDESIAADATRLARTLQNRFRRDQAAGLCASESDVVPLANPDAQQSVSRSGHDNLN